MSMNQNRLTVLLLPYRVIAMIIVACLFLPACVPVHNNKQQVVEISEQLSQQQNQMQALQNEVSQLSGNLSTQFESICNAQQAEQRNLLKARSRQIKSLQSDLEKIQSVCDEEQAATARLESKILLGELENVTLVSEESRFSARIDTGAETSSIGVYRQKLFERDGRQWVRFSLLADDDAPSYEYRVRGRVRIKQSALLEGEDRIEVRMTIKLGDKIYKRQTFNLSDRSYLEHPVLIGRSFLTDTAIVDTSSKYLLGR